MPKKFGINSKSAEAKAKKAEKQQSERAQEVLKKEQIKWVDTDKKVIAKEKRRREQEVKKSEALERKQQNKKLHDEEISTFTESKSKEPVKRLTQEEIEAKRKALITSMRPKNESTSHFVSEGDWIRIEEDINPNHAKREEFLNLMEKDIEAIDVRDLNSAVEALSKEGPDRHPEKRLKHAYSDYVEKRMPELKTKFPGMIRSQLMEKIWKKWKKAPENPLNQNNISYNAKV